MLIKLLKMGVEVPRAIKIDFNVEELLLLRAQVVQGTKKYLWLFLVSSLI